MHISFVLLLTVILHVSEGKNQTWVNRAKRRIEDDFVENVIFPDLIKKGLQHSFGKPGHVTKSNFYASILKNIADLVAVKKNELKDNLFPDQENVMFHSSEDCRDSGDKEMENDPSMTGFYTLSKMTSDEQKSVPWMNLLSSPFIQSLVRPKASNNHLRKNCLSPSIDKLRTADLKNSNRDIKGKDIDDESLNNIVQFFSSFGQGLPKKPQQDNVIGFTNQPVLNNESIEDKLASSCFVENKSNYFKTDSSSPFNKYIGAQELLARSNHTNFLGRPEKHSFSSNKNISYFKEDKVPKPSLTNDQLRNFITLGEYKASQWPQDKTEPINIPHFTNANNNAVRGNVIPEKELPVTKNKGKKPMDILSEINLDPPRQFSEEINSKFNESKYFRELLKQEIDNSHPPVLNENFENSLNINNSMFNPNVNLRNLIHSQDAIERFRLLNSFLDTNKIMDPSKSVFNVNSDKGSPMVNSLSEPKFLDNKCDINTLSKIFNYKMDRYEDKSDNVTTDSPNPGKSNRNNSIIADGEVNPIPSDSKVPPSPSVAIGENHPPPSQPPEIHPGHEKIILPEYEKMDNSFQDSSRTVEYSDTTEYNYIPSTTSVDNTHSNEPPPFLGADTLNALHRNMIPVIDFLGQMWNSPNRRNHVSGITVSKSLATDCGGYVIVPLPKRTMIQGLKQLEKTVSLSKDFNDIGGSNIVKNNPNCSLSGLVTSSNRDLLEKFVLRRLYDSFRGYLTPRRRARRSKSYEIIEDSHTQEASTTPSCPLNSTQLPPTDKWIISSSFG